MSRQRLVVFGAGGFAREVRWLAEEITRHGKTAYDFRGYVISDTAELTEHDSRDELLGEAAWLDEQRDAWDVLAVGIGAGKARVDVGAMLTERYGADVLPALVHPTVIADWESCTVAHGVLLCAGVIATVNVTWKPFALTNLACTIGHEATLGTGCVLNPTVNISGGVEIGAGALVGTGAQVLQYKSVGAEATVGAGSVVTKDVPAHTVVVGAPAKPLQRRA